jgi:hypothetical protein
LWLGQLILYWVVVMSAAILLDAAWDWWNL